MRAPFSRTLPDLLREQAERQGDRLAAVTVQGRATYAELQRRTGQVAGGLRRLGVGPGQRVALLVSNRLEWLDVLFGAGQLIRSTTVRPSSGSSWPSPCSAR